MDSYTFLLSTATTVLLPIVDFGYSSTKQRFEITNVFDEDTYVAWQGVYFRLLGEGTLPFILGLDSGYGYGLIEREVSFVPNTYHEAISNEGFKVVQFIVETNNIDYVLSETELANLISLYSTCGVTIAAVLERINKFATLDTLPLQ